MRWGDITAYADEENPYSSLFIQFSKTDQSGMGVVRSLYGGDTVMCPFARWKRYAIWEKGRQMHAWKSAPKNILGAIRSTIKWIAISLGFEPSYSSAQSIRDGGASTLFTNDVALDTIRRFCRWRPSDFHIYVYGGSLNFRILPTALCSDENPIDQILVANNARVQD